VGSQHLVSNVCCLLIGSVGLWMTPAVNKQAYVVARYLTVSASSKEPQPRWQGTRALLVFSQWWW
jgi:hypothetical protein